MKKILTFLLMIFTLSGFAQTDSLPKFYIDNGDTLGITISIDQAKKIYNDLEILKLLEKAMVDYDSLNTQYVQVINELEKQVAILNVKISDMEDINATQTQMIDNLQNQINVYESDKQLCNEQLKVKDEIIKNLNKEIRKQKWQKAGGFTAVSILSVVIVLIAI